MRSSRRAVALSLALAAGSVLAGPSCKAQDQGPVTTAPVARYVNPPVPLLTVGSLSFLEGSWLATSRDGKQQYGTYTWATELNGHVLARRSLASSACSTANDPACLHDDLMYVYQDSAGAPLRALFFDNEGHVIQYEISMRHDELPAGSARRDFAVFLSDAAALGPRYRLSYERSTDTQTGATTLSGRFEVLLANNQWRTLREWFGRKA